MLPELWLLVSTFCYSPLISYNSQGIEVGRLKCLKCPPKCIQKVEISTYPVTAKDGDTIYYVDNRTECEKNGHKWGDIFRKSTKFNQEYLSMYSLDRKCEVCGKRQKKIEQWEDAE